jgi:glycogen debranching enzyme
MSVDIKVGPPVLTINRGSTFMVTDLNGEIDQTKAQGLFAEDTRFLSTYQMYINDQPWLRVTSATVTYYAALLNLTNPRVLTPDGKAWIEEQTIALTLQRTINTGLHESFHICNYSQVDVYFMLELAMRSDFADLFQVKAERLTRRGHIETRWSDARSELITQYEHQDFSRQVIYRVREATSAPSYANGRLIFDVHLQPRAEWRAESEIALQHQSRRTSPNHRRAPHRREEGLTEDGSALEKYQQDWMGSCTEVQTPNNSVTSAYIEAIEDLGSLRLPEHDLGPDVWVPAAGVPWFVALFGRDSLIASYQAMMVHGPFARGALRELARYQATGRDDWRDAQPGKILHELRHGELAHFHQVPFTPYYGTADATILYLIVLHEYYKWTGDIDLVKEARIIADRCLNWIDEFGDLDHDGLQEWKTFSDQGYENMCWKDSGDGVVYRNGAQASQPKGTCELQGYVFDAKQRMAELYDVLDDPGTATRLRREAATLQRKFEQTYWMEDEGTYAFGLDAQKKQIDAVTSNPGHCLWSGIASPERAKRVADRMFQPDMWCGWGIRTLSSNNPAYNPFSYQRGSVWPHDNGIIAAGFKRYGFADELNKVAEGIFAAASFFDSFRLPEVFAGVERQPATFPSQYLGANIPQAWAAGTVPHLIRAILGLRPDAPNDILYVNPTLPDWLPEMTLHRLKVGNTMLDLRFWREGDSSQVEVLHRHGGSLEVKTEVEELPVPRTGEPPERAAEPKRTEQPPARKRRAGEAKRTAPAEPAAAKSADAAKPGRTRGGPGPRKLESGTEPERVATTSSEQSGDHPPHTRGNAPA